MQLFEMWGKKITWHGACLRVTNVKSATKIRAMVPIKCIFLWLNAATFRGISSQTRHMESQ